MFSIVKLIKGQAHLLKNFLINRPIYSLGKGKRVRELSQVKISIPSQPQQQRVVAQPTDYAAFRQSLKSLNWQEMEFDKLCALPQDTLAFINMELKKDKFNVDDSEFYQYSIKQLHIKQQQNDKVLENLNKYYRRLYHLLLNHHEQYDKLASTNDEYPYYTNEMYIMDLEKDQRLTKIIEYFINNLNHPKRLEMIAEPSFIKHLLSLKRELIMQGIHFESFKDEKIKKQAQRKQQKKQDIIEKLKAQDKVSQSIEEANDQEGKGELMSQQFLQFGNQNKQQLSNFDYFLTESLKQCKHKVKIRKVLGYEYEFWVDVKHNRGKNGVQQDYIIQERQIDNPNESMLVCKRYPKIRVRYIVHKKKRKDYTMHFCIKAHLLVNLSGSQRKIKIEWRGPSNSRVENERDTSFIIVDYQNIMKGNPTIKPIFFF